MSGYIQVYTGEGKGKTTAAIGLAVRAAGAGLHVFMAQFAKGKHYSEHQSLERFSDRITVRQYGRQNFILRGPQAEDREAARKGLEEIVRVITSGRYELVILDEANTASALGLIRTEDLLDLIDAKPARVELVITGRCADPRVVDRADLVTEMREVKHYYNSGVPARQGIEM